MKLHMIWGFDRHDEIWSCIDTWTDDQRAENPDGWNEALRTARIDDLLSDVRLVEVVVPTAEIRAALRTPVVRGSARASGEVRDA